MTIEGGLQHLSAQKVAEISDHNATTGSGDRLQAPNIDTRKGRRIYRKFLAAFAIGLLTLAYQSPDSEQGSLYYETARAQESTQGEGMRVTACFSNEEKLTIAEAAHDYVESTQEDVQHSAEASIIFDEAIPQNVPCISATVNEQGYTALKVNPATLAIAEDKRVYPSHHAAESRGGNMLIRTGADQAHHHGYDGTGLTIALIDSGVNFNEDVYTSYKTSLLEQSACIGVNYPPFNFQSGCAGGEERVIGERAGTFCLDGSGDCSHGHKIGQATHIAAPDANILSIAQNTLETVDGVTRPVFYLSEAVKGIDIALEMNADAIVYSMAAIDTGGDGCAEYFTPFNVAAQSAHAVDVPMFISTGNYGNVEFPACLHKHVPGIHAITSNDFSGDIPYHAGVETGVLSAMGQGFSVRSADGLESLTSGTSYGAATAAGLYADMAEALPDYSSEEVMSVFENNAGTAHASDGQVVPEMDIKSIFRNPSIGAKLNTFFRIFLPIGFKR